MADLPKDPMILLSVVNTKLRDFYTDLDTLCQEMQIEKKELTEKLASIDYEYDADVKFPADLAGSPDWEMVEEGEEQTYFSLCYTPEIYKRKQV